MRIDPDRTALLVIDMQNDFLLPGAPLESAEGRRMNPVVQRLVEAMRESGALVVYTRGEHEERGDLGRYREIYPHIAAGQALRAGTPGAAVHADLEPAAADVVVTKNRYSAFHGTELEGILRERGIDTLVLTGVTSENCVLSTARDAMFRGLRTVVVADACASYDHPDQGWGAMDARDVHAAVCVILAKSTSRVVPHTQVLDALPAARVS